MGKTRKKPNKLSKDLYGTFQYKPLLLFVNRVLALRENKISDGLQK